MGSIFGKCYEPTQDSEELKVFKGMDPFHIIARCKTLVPHMRKLIKAIIEEHKMNKDHSENHHVYDDTVDFVDVLLSLDVGNDARRVHPLGLLLSWASLSNTNVHLSNGIVVPVNTTTMVNMWAITRDGAMWDDPHEFNPKRFLVVMNGTEVSAIWDGTKVCPGKDFGMVTVALWVTKLLHPFEWAKDTSNGVDLGPSNDGNAKEREATSKSDPTPNACKIRKLRETCQQETLVKPFYIEERELNEWDPSEVQENMASGDDNSTHVLDIIYTMDELYGGFKTV
ncbi:hypothetical protein BUALT_Bualt11G0010000 [Buddleja alternifolia]|uniref:Cytochrome P450 n=1 Tax=Buddleja alternifolia TaxID=168488 RepID=A0AAV6WRN2_9LAMI|nr:hypothetical protein BUALT_Bualt11G0010000 [Buddleja alternifolia]